MNLMLYGRFSAVIPVTLCLLTLLFSSCVARRRVITRKGGTATQKLITTNKQVLLNRIADRYKAIQSFNATVDMVPALGSADKGKITEYKDVRAYMLFRKPEHIRIIGLFPVVRNKAFDMVSDGSHFEVYIPSKNRFVTGKNEVSAPSANKLENLRPQHFLEALLVKPVQKGETPLLQNFTDEENAAYVLHMIEKDSDGQLQLARDVWFDRLSLRIVRQIIFDHASNILSDARYSDWQGFDGVPFPKHIEINRPRDEYGVVITVIKMDINKPIEDEKFVLERPEGTTLQVLGGEPNASEGQDASRGPDSEDSKGKK